MKDILFALSLVGVILAQDLRETLPAEAQRRGPKPVYVIRTVELVFESLDSVMAQTDLVLLGRVVQISPRLSADQMGAPLRK